MLFSHELSGYGYCDRNAIAPLLKAAIDLGLTTAIFEETLQVIISKFNHYYHKNYGEIIVNLYIHELINPKS